MNPHKSPFKFLDPYTRDDKDFFFGRNDEVDALYNLGMKAWETGRHDRARSALSRFLDAAPTESYGVERRQAKVVLWRLEGAG